MGKTFLIAHIVPGSKQTVPPRRDASNANPGPHTVPPCLEQDVFQPLGRPAPPGGPGRLCSSRRGSHSHQPEGREGKRATEFDDTPRGGPPRGATGLQTPPGTRGRRPREQQERPTRAKSVGTVSGRRDLHPAHGPPPGLGDGVDGSPAGRRPALRPGASTLTG